MISLTRHQFTPGRSALPGAMRSASIDGSSPVLLTFLHPQCPCSRATLSELGLALEQANRPADVPIYFYKPRRESGSWVQGDLWNVAHRIDVARIMVDEDGRAANQWGARTSGEVL